MGWVDSHCHLNFPQFDPDRLFPELERMGCQGVLIPATTAQSWESVLQLKTAYEKFVLAAFGLHPYFIEQHQASDLESLDQYITLHKPCALGEFGLDAMLDAELWQQQIFYFNQQLEIAKQHKLPLVIHCRKAHDQLASLVKASGFRSGGFIHGFSGSLQQAKRYLDLGLVLGLGGALTYDRAKAMHKMVAALPDDAYTLETDSPDMAPAFAKAEVNTPMNIPKIAEYIARLRGQTLEKVFSDSTCNVERILNLKLGA
ncbi:MAG: TatD family hydrolase [Gammaproteobacteria bacterium]|nr:TatD family hydrolase [Gammaproteobacteria bacterium]